MKAKRIIACVISFILFTVCIPFTAIAEDLDTGLDRYRKYYSPAYTLESCTYTDNTMYNKTVSEDSVYFWNDIRHYDESFETLIHESGISNDDWYMYYEYPVNFSYSEFMSSEDCSSILNVKDISEINVDSGVALIENEFCVSSSGVSCVRKPTDMNNAIISCGQKLYDIGCEVETYIVSDNKSRAYVENDGYRFYDYVFNGMLFRRVVTSYRIGTMCEIETSNGVFYMFVSDCNATSDVIADIFNETPYGDWYGDWYMLTSLSEQPRLYEHTLDCAYDGYSSISQLPTTDINMPKNKETVTVNYNLQTNICTDEYWNNAWHSIVFSKELDPNVNYNKNLEVYADTFNVNIPVTTDDGVRFVDNDYTIKFWYDGSFQIVDSGETVSSVTETSFYWNKKETDYKNSTSTSQYVNGKYQKVDKVQTYGDTLNYDADNDRLCTIRNGKITYLTEDQLHYTLNIYADNGTETTKVASYDIQLFAPQQRRTIIYNTIAQEPPVVDPVTAYQYKTITYNNGNSAYRIKTNSDVSDIQKYIDKLEAENALLRQENTELKNRINLLDTGTYGDVTGDGTVTVEDSMWVLMYYTEHDVALKTQDSFLDWCIKRKSS